jgi:hypothetical protein
MRNLVYTLATIIFLIGCGEEAVTPQTQSEATSPQAQSNVLSLDIDGWSFVGLSEIASGWTTIRVNNDSGMTHFGLVYRLPEGVTAQMVSDQVVKPFQAVLTASLEGDFEKAGEIAKTVPAWIGEIIYFGGPGMMSDGNYVVECYVKTNGVQHNFNPEPGAHGMVHALTVTDNDGGMSEPDANVTLEISNAGYEVAEGQFVPGENSVRVKFKEQRLYNNFVGHDAHFFKIAPETNVAEAAKWVDFFPIDGQQTPAPAYFVGGIHDMPEGSTAYVKLVLEEGEYGIVAEVPNAQEVGLFKTFKVAPQ